MSGVINSIGSKSGVIGTVANLNHDAEKNSWHIYRSSPGDWSGAAAVMDFDSNTFIGSNVSEAGGRITVTTAGLYLIMCSLSRYYNSSNTMDINLRIDTTVRNGARLYHSSGTQIYGGKSGGWMVPLNAGQTVDMYGTAYIHGDTNAMSYFSGTRIGANT